MLKNTPQAKRHGDIEKDGLSISPASEFTLLHFTSPCSTTLFYWTASRLFNLPSLFLTNFYYSKSSKIHHVETKLNKLESSRGKKPWAFFVAVSQVVVEGTFSSILPEISNLSLGRIFTGKEEWAAKTLLHRSSPSTVGCERCGEATSGYGSTRGIFSGNPRAAACHCAADPQY